MADYFGGYKPDQIHPYMGATGSEGRCELCGDPPESPFHEQPMAYCHNVQEVNGAFQVVEPKDAKP